MSALVQIATQPWGTLQDRAGNARTGVAFTLTNPGGGTPTRYKPDGVTVETALATDANGNVPGYIAPGSYTLTIGGVVYSVEAVTGIDSATVADLAAKRFVQSRFPIFGPIGGLGFQLDRLQTTYATPTAFSASSMQLYALATATVSFAQVQFIWTPNAAGCGLRLIQFDGGPVNIVQIAEATGHTETTPIPSSVDITTAVQALAPGAGKYLGWQWKGDGTVGPLIYAAWVDIVWSV